MLDHARPRRERRGQPKTRRLHAVGPAPAEQPSDATDAIAPLLPAQRRIWLRERLFPGGAAHVVPIVIRLEGKLDDNSLQRALDALVARHPALRTTFAERDGDLIQRVAPATAVPLTRPRLRRKTTGRNEADAASAPRLLVDEAIRTPFDLERGPLLRAQLVKRAPRSHLLMLLVHGSVCDDDSLRILVRDFGALYRAFAAGLRDPLPPLPLAPHDIAAMRAAAQDGDAAAADLAWWRTALAGLEPVDLPSDRALPALPSERAGRHPVAIPRDVIAPLIALGASERADLRTIVQAAFAALLARATGAEDIAIGTPVSSRAEAARGVVGQFANTVILRADLAGDPTFRDLVGRVRGAAREAFAHAATPFERIVATLNPEQSLHRAPLVPVTFTLRDDPPDPGLSDLLDATVVDVDPGALFDDLRLDLTLNDSTLTGWWRYRLDRFEPATIARLADRFALLLRAVVADPDRSLSAIPLLTESERRLILDEWNPPASPLPEPVAIDAVFQRQAAATPDAPALRFGSETVSYAELARRAADLARVLRDSGVTDGTTVGVCLDRTPSLPVALLATLQAGGVCLPLDPAWPAARLAYMVEHAEAALVVTDAHGATALPDNGIPRLRLDRPLEPVAAASGPRPELAGADAAYLVYTSGSTGAPKGVVTTHRGAVNLCQWLGQAYPFAADDVCAYVASASFVDTIWDLFGPLLNGAATVVVPDAIRKDPERLLDVLADERVTRLLLPPSLLRALLDTDADMRERTPALRLLFSTAETLSPDLAARVAERLPQARLINTYGSSETTAVVTTGEANPDLQRPRVPIGRPIANSRVCILDARGDLAPVGVPGDIAVGGAAAAAGYLGQPDLTAATFVLDQFATDGTSRLVRTGDRGRWLNDGAIELLGRADRMVKIRGFRVEPGEVESALARHPAIAEAAVVAQVDGRAGARLLAYIVGRQSPAPAASDLRAFLRGALPDYMIPAQFVALPEMPRTPTGKLDRRALPADPAPADRAPHLAPRNPTEAALAAIWESLLDVRPIGVDDDFFDLGGHSLLVVRAMVATRDAFGVDLPARTLFESPTIAALAARIDAARVGAAPADDAEAEPSLTPLNQRPGAGGIFLVPGGAGEAFNLFPFAKLFRRAAPERPAWGFLGRERFDGDGSAHDWVRSIAARYVRELRAQQPDGPYVVIGACAGGNIAFEMAQQLHAAGAAVERLILIDVWHAGGRSIRRAGHVASREEKRPDALRLQERLALRRPGNLAGSDAAVAVATGTLRADSRETLERRFWLNQYVAEPYPLPITVLVNEEWHTENTTLGWHSVAAGGLEVCVMTGGHNTYLDDHFEETVALLGALLAVPRHEPA